MYFEKKTDHIKVRATNIIYKKKKTKITVTNNFDENYTGKIDRPFRCADQIRCSTGKEATLLEIKSG